MAVDRTVRAEHFIKSTTERNVGPGAYQPKREVDRSLKTNTIARGQLYRIADRINKRRKNKGSIRADFEGDDSSSEEGNSPAPGQHLNAHHVSTFNK